MKKVLFTILAMFLTGIVVIGQEPSKEKSYFQEYEPGYYQNFILKDVRHFDDTQKPKQKAKYFLMDQTGMDLPNNLELYTSQWYNLPISQGNTGSCWCFSTTSLFETDIYRITGQKVKLSEMYAVYWEYVEKAKGFVKTRGSSLFAQGSEGNAVTRIYRDYGVVPESTYNGLQKGRKYYSHSGMMKEMKSYLTSVKKDNTWNEELVISTIKSILNHHMGEPPTEFDYNGKEITPMEYMKDVLKFNPDDYVEILSYMQEPYWQQVEYKVPDNWWHSKDYYNVPLDIYLDIIKKSIRDGYTMSIGGDVSEAGFSRKTNCALIPEFDIPSEYINENARQFRFSNQTTTDDHGMHLVGYYEKDGKDWYLIKDSSSGSRNVGEDSPIFGYYFFSSDYNKLKMMGFTIHKDAVKDVLKKFK